MEGHCYQPRGGHTIHMLLYCTYDTSSFAHAGQHAYGAIVFFTQDSRVSFVTAKTHVAPLKALTISRIELMAAMVATHLTNNNNSYPQPTNLHVVQQSYRITLD